jgi:hypothetical protein
MKRFILAGLLLVVGCSASSSSAPTTGGMRAERGRTETEPVDASMSVVATEKIRAGGTFSVLVTLDVAPGFEIQNQRAPPPGVATDVALKLPPGFRSATASARPQTVRSQWPDGHPVYVGQLRFYWQVGVGEHVTPGEYEVGCAIRYQACNDRFCLRPVEYTLPARVEVRR